ncbi:saccharopine dehydrogenase NADP-binding domain-containing protein [Rhodanobacter sp. AS-Z3]|uniref:saccharopine dehydrogenase family protein n=1 Tax=Rhodanobacter sp. AS-Z3 TaxID=3031330 RepID=UPI00247B07CE|nr:saccharopine dehydrogenase NADP-binding domain-containing protein [Rhodanobacter sp. AS-Z3]WEN15889.1 saccharopine dehydrogenase NADP-binding domain-containing protein [Rhodanobacter sp. AS-Z3]
MTLRVTLIGASGVFGSRIASQLAGDPRFLLTLAGRNVGSLAVLRDALGDASVQLAALDVTAPDLLDAFAALQSQLVIHAAGPFQGRDYRVAEACLTCGSDYIDLADGRDFVSGFGRLDVQAKKNNRLLISGASTVPALSSAVVDSLLPRFAELDVIEHAISPGNRTPRGDATVAAILGYCGRPVKLWRDGRWQQGHGWMLTRRAVFPFGRRWVGLCDVPDLELFPVRYPGVRTVVFRAGLELKLLHFGTLAAAWLVRLGVVRNLARHATRLRRLSEWFLAAGSDVGGMQVALSGRDAQGQSLTLRWSLRAAAGDGPQIPATPAVVLARKLADGSLSSKGAMPCMGLFTLEEALSALDGFAIDTQLDNPTG